MNQLRQGVEQDHKKIKAGILPNFSIFNEDKKLRSEQFVRTSLWYFLFLIVLSLIFLFQETLQFFMALLETSIINCISSSDKKFLILRCSTDRLQIMI